jgi:hypothetical protein
MIYPKSNERVTESREDHTPEFLVVNGKQYKTSELLSQVKFLERINLRTPGRMESRGRHPKYTPEEIEEFATWPVEELLKKWRTWDKPKINAMRAYAKRKLQNM